jgi:hypothetical protein
MESGECEQGAVVSLVARLGAAAAKNRPSLLRLMVSKFGL